MELLTIKSVGGNFSLLFPGIAKHHCPQISFSSRLRASINFLCLGASLIWRFWKNKTREVNASYFICLLCFVMLHRQIVLFFCNINHFL